MSTNPIRLGPTAEEFIWAGGIEDTFVPQTRPGHRALDEYELTGHYNHWRQDLARVRDTGVQALRWGVPWYRVEPQPGVFDWSWTDQVLPHMVEELGITPIVDLMHYGCPFWLRGEFDNPAYPEAVAAYAAAFARRYAGLVRWYTPLNEPIVNSWMCGQRGQWPPYLRGDKGYLRVLVQLVRGIFQTVAAIRAVQPDARMVHVEAAGWRLTQVPQLAGLVEEDMLQHFLPFDLLTGRVTPAHPLFATLVRKGVPPRDLIGFTEQPITLDVMGINFYPQWATREVYLNRKGEAAYRIADKGGAVFAEMLEAYYRRYGVPIIVTETSARDSDAVRANWLATSLAAIKGLRARGVPVLGYTWFPLFTMYDWRYRTGKKPLAAYRLELGLYTLDEAAPTDRWRPTALLDRFRQVVAHPAEAIGPLVSTPPISLSAHLEVPHG